MSFVVPLALAGLAVSLFFALVDAGRVAPDARMVPSFCRLDGERCGLVLRHPHARLPGIPNYAAGTGYYLFVLLSELTPLPAWTGMALLILSWAVVAAGVFLVYSLYAIIRVPCPLCLTAHGVNLLLALSFTFASARP